MSISMAVAPDLLSRSPASLEVFVWLVSGPPHELLLSIDVFGSIG